jgi:RNA polymerase sigma-70 factor, ECF subfamily
MSTILPISTHDLVNQLRNKSREGFAHLYDNYAPTLFGIICKIVRDEVVAEDVLQESFVKVWKNIQHYNEEKGSLFTWLLNITRYTAIDYLRSRQHKQEIKNQNLASNEYTEGMMLVNDEPEYTGLKGIVAKLEPKYREVIDLIYFKGYTQDEVSKILAIPLGTVKTRTRMGLQILRNQL